VFALQAHPPDTLPWVVGVLLLVGGVVAPLAYMALRTRASPLGRRD
jgi:uncharacterized membrane protein HdeD (DUF308 family)